MDRLQRHRATEKLFGSCSQEGSSGGISFLFVPLRAQCLSVSVARASRRKREATMRESLTASLLLMEFEERTALL
jgi:hypothetical protein